MEDLTPQQVVEALDRHIVGQHAAKRAVAIAIRNRWRRMQLPEDQRANIGPSNMILIGPTGVGKTEIARRLARLVNAPFIKVEATTYTEVGYHGRDVESMIRDLVESAVHTVRAEQTEVIRVEAERRTEEQMLDVLLPPATGMVGSNDDPADREVDERRRRNREKLRAQLRGGELDDRMVEVRVPVKAAPIGMISTVGPEQLDADIQGIIERLMPGSSKTRTVPVREARRLLFDVQCEQMIDRERVAEIAVGRVENAGIVFIDEIDKLATSGQTHGPDVSRQGVQRDLLPLIEGRTVSTRYGPVRTDHILFIAAGAFQTSKPSDLMPELQGRLPIRVELQGLERDDFVRILRDPQHALTKQHTALLATEGVGVTFTDDAIDALADLAHQVNQVTENIGARRLITIMEKLMEEVSFDAPSCRGQSVRIDRAYVERRLRELNINRDLSRFIL